MKAACVSQTQCPHKKGHADRHSPETGLGIKPVAELPGSCKHGDFGHHTANPEYPVTVLSLKDELRPYKAEISSCQDGQEKKNTSQYVKCLAGPLTLKDFPSQQAGAKEQTRKTQYHDYLAIAWKYMPCSGGKYQPCQNHKYNADDQGRGSLIEAGLCFADSDGMVRFRGWFRVQFRIRLRIRFRGRFRALVTVYDMDRIRIFLWDYNRFPGLAP